MGNALRRMALAAGVLLFMVSLPAGPAAAGHKGAKAAKAVDSKSPPKGFNVKATNVHLRDHQRYPVTKEEILAECDNLSDFTDADRRWFTDKLPAGTYRSPEEVLEAVGLLAAPQARH